MSVEEVDKAIDEVSDVIKEVSNELGRILFKLSDARDKINRMNDMIGKEEEELCGLVNPAGTYVICKVRWDVGDTIRVKGLKSLEFKRYTGEVKVVLDSDLETKELMLEDGTRIDFMWVEDVAAIFAILRGAKRKDVLKDMMANVYSSGKDKPVGFLYGEYFAVIAPMEVME